jgi:hypothetical protein
LASWLEKNVFFREVEEDKLYWCKWFLLYNNYWLFEFVTIRSLNTISSSYNDSKGHKKPLNLLS